MVDVEIIGFDRLISRLIRFQKALEPAAVKGVKDVARDIRDDAKSLAPVDTGSLRKSIRIGASARTAGHTHMVRVTAGGYITNPKTERKVDYAIHQEFGTSKMHPQPFLGPAVRKHKESLAKAIKEAIRE